jgi:hypothetical protein
MEVEVVRELAGWQESPSGIVSNRYELRDVATGKLYLFDTFSEWKVGERRLVSVEIQNEQFFFNPRPVKSL